MKHISKYSFSIGFLLCSLLISAQQQNPQKTAPKPVKQKVEATDTIPPRKERYGLRLGVDLFKLTRGFYDKGYKGIELTGDYRLTRKYYLAAEIGTENKETDEVLLDFTTKGSYLKVGFDYNAHENWLNLENMIFVGLRYGFSTFSQQLNSYDVYNPNPYFEENPEIQAGEKFSGLSAQWGEVVVGMKTQVIRNIFVGLSFRMNYLISNKRPAGFDNLYIPGFNRTYDGDFGVGFNYTVSYFLPLYKKKVPNQTAAPEKK